MVSVKAETTCKESKWCLQISRGTGMGNVVFIRRSLNIYQKKTQTNPLSTNISFQMCCPRSDCTEEIGKFLSTAESRSLSFANKEGEHPTRESRNAEEQVMQKLHMQLSQGEKQGFWHLEQVRKPLGKQEKSLLKSTWPLVRFLDILIPKSSLGIWRTNRGAERFHIISVRKRCVLFHPSNNPLRSPFSVS